MKAAAILVIAPTITGIGSSRTTEAKLGWRLIGGMQVVGNPDLDRLSQMLTADRRKAARDCSASGFPVVLFGLTFGL